MPPPISTPSTAPHPTGGLRSSPPQQAGGCCPCPPGLRPTRGRAHKLPGAHAKARVRGRACCVQELLARTGGRVGRELVPATARASAHGHCVAGFRAGGLLREDSLIPLSR
ncbi:hypothetical protein PVAP13_7KG223155 [Panicum virgatum]|uniref:Uncharacterized protein n=1 Tax=Panicum virgatum TaxID=38727 RepID=A0A8T0QNI5_PANVG|nr:hypothetical protein PVAP13_7KG223155 [Panicum virgatum]